MKIRSESQVKIRCFTLKRQSDSDTFFLEPSRRLESRECISSASNNKKLNKGRIRSEIDRNKANRPPLLAANARHLRLWLHPKSHFWLVLGLPPHLTASQSDGGSLGGSSFSEFHFAGNQAIITPVHAPKIEAEQIQPQSALSQ